MSNPIDNIIHNNYRPDRLSNRTNWLVAPFFRILKGCVAWKSAFFKKTASRFIISKTQRGQSHLFL